MVHGVEMASRPIWLHTSFALLIASRSVSKQFLSKGDKVLIIDDFLAKGSALKGLISLIEDAGAEVVGAGIVIEKAYQPGGELIRSMGVRVESLARIASMNEEEGVRFVAE